MTKHLATATVVICLVVVGVLHSVQLMALDLEFYTSQWVQLGVPHDTGMDLQELSRSGRSLIDYLVGSISSPQIETTVFGSPRLLYNELELQHLEDVRELFAKGFRFQQILLVGLLLGGLYLAWSYRLKSLSKPLMTAGFIGVGLLLLLALPAKIDFGRWWTRFHIIAFANDLWLLDPSTDWLIRMFPEGFFVSAIQRIGITYLGFCAAYVLLGFLVGHLASNHGH
ncbi:MAG: TIGR01906 family membrane protein [Bacillota bacterium]